MALTILDPSGRGAGVPVIERLRRRMAVAYGSDGFDATELMVSWMKILDEDNRRGILAGTDKDGVGMVPVRYRPVGRALRPTGAQRNTANARARRGALAGFGPSAAGLHNNLTREEYEKLGGPPLAPRGAFSRVITNYVTDYAMLRRGMWQVTFWWDQVVSMKGVPFLRAHFDGMSVGRGHKVKLPRRDLRGIRPEGQKTAVKAARNWLLGLIRRSAA